MERVEQERIWTRSNKRMTLRRPASHTSDRKQIREHCVQKRRAGSLVNRLRGLAADFLSISGSLKQIHD